MQTVFRSKLTRIKTCKGAFLRLGKMSRLGFELHAAASWMGVMLFSARALHDDII